MSLRDLVMSVGFSGSKAMKGLKGVDKAADKTKKNFTDLGKQAKETGKGVGKIGQDAMLAERGLKTLGRGLDAAKQKTRELGAEAKKVGQQMRTEFKSAMEDAAPKNMFDGAKRAGATALAAGAAGVGVLAGGAKTSISFESAFAGVRKTVDATEEEYAAIRQQIRDMTKEIPALHEEIAGVAESAGQLGISETGLMGFTRTMVDLGVATNMTSDEAATSLARFANITQMAEKDYGRLGSTIVDLGNNLATTESEIVAMGMRLAGAGAQIGMSEAGIMSFAGALSSVGIEADAGGTAFSKVMIDMASQVATNGEKLGQFAQVAGMSVAEFKEAYQKDAAGTIISFTEGLGRMSAAGENVFGVLDDLGFSEIRVRDALLRASGAGDLFRRSMDIGSQAWEKNLALSKEAAERYKTTESRLTILKNKFRDMGITLGDMLLPHIEKVTDVMGNFIEKLEGLPPGVKKFGAMALIAGTALMLIAGPILLLIGFLPSIAAGFSMLGTISLGALGPIALAIAGVVAAGILLYKNWDKVKAFGLSLWDSFKAKIEPFAPYIENVFNTLKTIIGGGLAFIKGIVDAFLIPFQFSFTFAWELIKNTVITAVEIIGGVLGGLFQALSGIIDFVAGVFTGDWGRAWQGVQDIFGGIFNGFKAIAKGAINAVIGIVNAGISGVNSLKAPDWVPGLGGKSPNIPLIPKLAKGTHNFGGGLAMVGEQGPELVHLPRGSRVTPNDESRRMLGGGYAGGDTFAPVINISIEGGSGSVKESIPDIKREIEKALYPALENYFQQLRSKRPSMTLT